MAALPTPFRPMAMVQLRTPFHRDGWVYEEKCDGYRCLAFKQGDAVALVSRNLKNLGPQFPNVVAAVAALPASTIVLDGEIAVFDERLVSHLGYLGRHAKKFARGRLVTPTVLVAFDCLFTRGRDLRAKPLSKRRDALERELADAAGHVVVARRLDANGLRAWDQVRAHDWEGLVAKDERSIYEPGKRTDRWIKVKHRVRVGWPEDGVERRGP